MEQEIPFKIFPLQRLSSSHVSAVKPHTVVENTSFFQNLKSPLGIENIQNIIHSNSDCISQKVSPLPVIAEESPESINQLYSKLHREAEKIKKWKSAVEFEVKEKEAKLHEKRKMVDAQRKVIKELQFENGKLRFKLEDVIRENEDLVNQSNSTRHVCNLLKDTCDRAAEKANMYENEIDDTRHMYGDLNNNIEQMIMAFEELREKAESSRQEIYDQIKQEAGKRQEMQKEQNLELARSRKQILELTKDREERDSKLSDLKFQLHESINIVKVLEEASKNYHLDLEKYKRKTEEMIQQTEEANLSLQNTKNALTTRENELQNVRGLLTEATEEKQARMKESEDTKAHHVLQISALQSEVESLKEALLSEQTKLEESETQLKMANVEAHDKSVELDEIIEKNVNHKKEIQQLKCDLDESIKVQRDLEKQVAKEKSENQILMNKKQDLVVYQENLQEQFRNIVMENTDLKKLVGDLQEVQKQLEDTLKNKEEAMDVLTIKITASSVDIEGFSRQIEELKTEISHGKLNYAELKMTYEKVFKEKEEMARKIDILTKDITNIEKELKATKQHRDQTMKTIENIEQTNDQLRKENESLKEQMKEKDKDCRNQQNECEDKKRNIESEFSKKEKQQKTLENKLCSLKKQVENKNKTIEELQQEKKLLKKKMKEGCKECSVLEAEVNGLHVQIKNARIQYEATVSSKQTEIADVKAKEEILQEEAVRLKLASDEAIRLQRETDIKCQHKIAEMVALMEKHKHQYDKMVEEKDAELGQFRAREQDIASTRALMETDLSNKNNEIVTLRMQLQKEKEEKDTNLKVKMCSKTNMKHKEVQTVFTDTPKQSTKIGDIQNSSSYSKKTLVTDVSSCLETGKKSDNKDTSPWMSSRSCKYTVPKTYSVKTPSKYEMLQHENINIHPQDSAKKKRKVALEFDFHSDSSDQTDILGICDNEGMFKALYQMPRTPSDAPTVTPKRIVNKALLKSPGPALKTSTMKKIQEAGWAAISKVDRRRKMKAAEKIFR